MESIGWQDHDGARWIQLEGEIDYEAATMIGERFRDAVEEGAGDIVIVMDGVTFFASAGLRLLLEARETLTAQGRSIRLTGLRPNVRRVLEDTNLLALFDAD